ncbi:MAG: ABC transporter permease subunit [Pseudomonadota bacterium]|nr:ABC transporter permease subunit [Pseudomonadota bacterium]
MSSSSFPEEKFRWGMLLSDTRYRGTSLQVITFIVFVAVFFWLVDNTLKNLALLGKDVSFDFLWIRAGYDINQRLIPYTNDSTHAMAALVGILNTLLCAFVGCIIATILGVFVGILRLSKNWIVAKLMSVYIEGFRNVPVLLWIVMVFALLTEFTPAPKAFKGANPEASMFLFDSIAITNRGTYFPAPVWGEGSIWLLIVFFLSVFAVLTLKRHSTKVKRATGKDLPTFWISILLLVAPVVAVYFFLGKPITLNYPFLKGFNFKEGIHLRNSFIALTLALALYTSAFIAEIVRAGILAISKGQTEAAASLGMRPNKIMNLIILPQALRVIVPPLISNYLNLTKNSSLAIAVGYMDVRGTLGGITLNQTGRELESMLLLMGFYLSVSLLISSVINFYNRSFQIVVR